jgi:hypothetical protein
LFGFEQNLPNRQHLLNFYTKIKTSPIKDIGYAGNTPTIWDGVPNKVLKQYNISYSQKELNECVKKENHNKTFTFSS